MPKFEVLRGVHYEGGKTYYVGDIVDSQSDLTKLNSPGSLKFRQIAEQSDPLDSLTVVQLKALAMQEDIDLGDATRKSEILAVIREAGEEAQAAAE